MKKILLHILLALTFIICTVLFADLAIEDGDLAMIAPAIIFALLAVLLVFVFVRCAVLGLNNYHFENNSLQITRKSRQISRIDKNEVEGLVVVSDIWSQEIHFITLRAYGRKWVVFYSGENKEGLSDFIEGLPCERKNNLWYYLLELLSW